ncbi:MAG: RlmE family RNA methyltransferase [Deltaproteobacteria bacterium]|nr:RlmE family RNA methyltransferase [Deltaproteobacteria bacterium]
MSFKFDVQGKPGTMAYNRKDTFYQKAKQEGYRSRAAYKLLELHRELRIFRHGDRVIDLGSWPGGWVQVAASLVGNTGKVIGIDLVALDPLSLPNVTLMQGDATDPRQQEQLLALLGGQGDVLLSDMAPKLSGIRETDEAHATELCRTALACAPRLVRPGGTLLLKVFMGSEYKAFLAELREAFTAVKVTRPEATRKGSAETYVLATGLKTVSLGVDPTAAL